MSAPQPLHLLCHHKMKDLGKLLLPERNTDMSVATCGYNVQTSTSGLLLYKLPRVKAYPVKSIGSKTMTLYRPNCWKQWQVRGRQADSCSKPNRPLMLSVPTWSSKCAGARRRDLYVSRHWRTPSENWAIEVTCIKSDPFLSFVKPEILSCLLLHRKLTFSATAPSKHACEG